VILPLNNNVSLTPQHYYPSTNINLRVNEGDETAIQSGTPITEINSGDTVILSVATDDAPEPFLTYTISARATLATGGAVSFITTGANTYDEIHTFTYENASSLPGYVSGGDQATFNFTPCTTISNARILVVAGGGGGGNGKNRIAKNRGGGGGGAGGYIYTSSTTISAGTKTVKVGKGGNGSTGTGAKGGDGKDSKFDATQATGGGTGGVFNTNDALNNGNAGGSSGGGCTPGATKGSPGGTSPNPSPAGQGNKGGASQPYASYDYLSGGGGGGKGGVGGEGNTTGSGNSGGAGGSGASNDISGVAYTYSSGGNGGGNGNARSVSTRNYGDGGDAGKWSTGNGVAGHSGIVIVRFPYPVQ
jgi:hypothetical protein